MIKNPTIRFHSKEAEVLFESVSSRYFSLSSQKGFPHCDASDLLVKVKIYISIKLDLN